MSSVKEKGRNQLRSYKTEDFNQTKGVVPRPRWLFPILSFSLDLSLRSRRCSIKYRSLALCCGSRKEGDDQCTTIDREIALTVCAMSTTFNGASLEAVNMAIALQRTAQREAAAPRFNLSL